MHGVGARRARVVVEATEVDGRIDEFENQVWQDAAARSVGVFPHTDDLEVNQTPALPQGIDGGNVLTGNRIRNRFPVRWAV